MYIFIAIDLFVLNVAYLIQFSMSFEIDLAGKKSKRISFNIYIFFIFTWIIFLII